MLELLSEIGMLPFWLLSCGVTLCLVAAWFRKSRRAAGAALTTVWLAGLFYVPYFFFQYAAYSRDVEASAVGEVLDPDDRRRYAQSLQAAATYAVLLSVTSATYLVLKSYKRPPPRKGNLQVELAKALQEKHRKAVEKAKAEGGSPPAERSDREPDDDGADA